MRFALGLIVFLLAAFLCTCVGGLLFFLDEVLG